VGSAAGDHAAVLVDVGDADLDRAVVLCFDQAAGCGALAGNVQVDEVTLYSGKRKRRLAIVRERRYFDHVIYVHGRFPFLCMSLVVMMVRRVRH
jgi:hypothetical protein